LFLKSSKLSGKYEKKNPESERPSLMSTNQK